MVTNAIILAIGTSESLKEAQSFFKRKKKK